MEFYCLIPNGIRAGYPASALRRSLSGKLRRAVTGRTVLLLTANPHYALHGGDPPGQGPQRPEDGAWIPDPPDTWYLTGNGPSHGLIKVQHGVIAEVGIVDKQLTSRGYKKNFRFLNSSPICRG